MTAIAQLNARMSRSLKEAGDDALATIGLSPTQAVRALWEKAAKRGKDLDEVATVLLSRPGASDNPVADDPHAKRLAMIDDAIAQLDIDLSSAWKRINDDDAIGEALYERMVERSSHDPS